MATTVPTWTEQGALLASTSITATNTSRTTVNLRSVYGARLFIAIGRTNATAYTGNAPTVIVRPYPTSAGTINFRAPATQHSFQCGSVTAVAPTISGAVSAAATSFAVSSATGLTVGDLMCLSPGDSGQEEWIRISRINSTTIYPDAPVLNAHDNADTATNQADCFEVWVPGGSYYEVIIDYGGASAGPGLRAQIYYQTYDSDTTS